MRDVGELIDAWMTGPDKPVTPSWKPTPRYAEPMFDLARGTFITAHKVDVTEQELFQLAVDAGLKKKDK